MTVRAVPDRGRAKRRKIGTYQELTDYHVIVFNTRFGYGFQHCFPYSPKWQFRFNFFEQHGAPNSPGFKAAFKTLTFGQKIKINFNFFALFFSWIYLLILGMWRKALTILGITLVLMVIVAFLPDVVGRAIGMAWAVLIALTTNYSYYLEKVKGDTSWNPFAGMRW